MCRMIRHGDKWDLREKWKENSILLERVAGESIGQMEQERCLEGSVYSWFSIRKLCFYWQGRWTKKVVPGKRELQKQRNANMKGYDLFPFLFGGKIRTRRGR